MMATKMANIFLKNGKVEPGNLRKQIECFTGCI